MEFQLNFLEEITELCVFSKESFMVVFDVLSVPFLFSAPESKSICACTDRFGSAVNCEAMIPPRQRVDSLCAREVQTLDASGRKHSRRAANTPTARGSQPNPI